MAIPIAKMMTVGILPSPIKVLYYRLRGAKIGKKVKIGMFSVISASHIEIGDYSKIGTLTFINCKKMVLGKRVKINTMSAIDTGDVFVDDDSIIMEQVVIGGMLTPRSRLIVGKRVKIFPYSFLNPTEEIFIGDDAGIGGANYIFTHGSWQSILDGYPVSFGPVRIEKGVWFPWRVFVMPNVTVGEYATIGAGSVITKNIPARCLAAGSPAKVLRQENEYVKTLTDIEKKDIIKQILNEFVDFLKYKYEKKANNVTFNEDENGIVIQFIDRRIIRFIDNFKSDLKQDALIVFDSKGESLSHQQIYFDLLQKKSQFVEDVMWTEIKDFFSRYGIRFELG